MLTCAIVGCGGIGKLHARAYSRLADARLIGMIDVIPEAARAAGAEFGVPGLASLEELPEKPDLVSVVTPPAHHYDVILKLLGMGVPVFSEKPLTTDVSQAEAIVAASEAAKLPVGMGFKMRYEPVFQKARELAPRIGKLAAISVTKHQPYTPRPHGWVPEVGCMYELSVHEYDLVNWIFGLKPESVRAELGYEFGWSKENRAFLDVNYAGGVKGQLMSLYLPETVFTFKDLCIIAVGDKGWMRVERPDRIFLHTDKDETFDVEPLDNLSLFEQELGAFVDCLKQGRAVSPDARVGADMTRLVEAARASSKRGERVSLEEAL